MRSFKALLKRAGLPVGTRLYDLLYTCVTLLLNSNRHPKYVQELLGRASISQTLDTYSHVLKRVTEESVVQWTKLSDRLRSRVAAQEPRFIAEALSFS